MNQGAVVTRWWWVRHGKLTLPPGTMAGQGDFAVDLSDTEMIPGTRRRLPDALWLTSPLSRSRDSARALFPGGPLQVDPDLTEQDFGHWTGQSHAGIWDQDPNTAAHFWNDPVNNAPPGGESFAALCQRVVGAIDRWNQTAAGRDIIMVGHAGPIRAALALALGIAPDRALSVAVDYWHLFRLDHIAITGQPGQWRLIGANIPP